MCIHVYTYTYTYVYEYIYIYIHTHTYISEIKSGGKVLLTEMLLPRIARKGAVCLMSIRGQARKT